MKTVDTAVAQSGMDQDIQYFNDAFSEWIDDPDITIACGRWNDGAILELIPQQRATLLPAAYDGCFLGVRELRLDGSPHHLHVDFGRIHRMSFAVSPSVCLAFKPSFEVRFLVLGAGGAPTNTWMISLMLSMPYQGNQLEQSSVLRFFQRAASQARKRPDLVEINIDPAVKVGALGGDVLALILKATGSAPNSDWYGATALWRSLPSSYHVSPEPLCLPLLHEALALKDASLVIYRERALIEFKTERLDGIHRYEEEGHVSWQIGALDDHHCHLALGAVSKVLFSAEPVSCQGGGLNYTVWFLTSDASGNPYRRDGYFSVVLNRPYQGNSPRLDVIAPVLALYNRFSDEPFVEADAQFMQVLKNGAPARHQGESAHA
jgi:hypothetical protein